MWLSIAAWSSTPTPAAVSAASMAHDAAPNQVVPQAHAALDGGKRSHPVGRVKQERRAVPHCLHERLVRVGKRGVDCLGVRAAALLSNVRTTTLFSRQPSSAEAHLTHEFRKPGLVPVEHVERPKICAAWIRLGVARRVTP